MQSLPRTGRLRRAGWAPAVIALCGTLLSASVGAQWRLFDFDFDENSKSWSEIEAQLPAAPKPGGLIRFEVGGGTPHEYLIDPASLSVGEDGVVRYTLVVRTSGGAVNVSFEGIRCDTRQQKSYAFGRADGRWSRAREPQWRSIPNNEMSGHHGELYGEYICADRRMPRNVQEVVDRLKYGRPSF